MDYSVCFSFVKSFVNVFEIIALLHTRPELEFQEILCFKLSEAKTSHVEFFLPQLCNLVLSSPPEASVEPLTRLLLNLCKRSLKLGFLVFLSFQCALNDYLQLPHSADVALSIVKIKRHIYLSSAAIIQSNKDIHLAKIASCFITSLDLSNSCSDIEATISNIRPIDFFSSLEKSSLSDELSEFTRANIISYRSRQAVDGTARLKTDSVVCLESVEEAVCNRSLMFGLSDIGGFDGKLNLLLDDVLKSVYGEEDAKCITSDAIESPKLDALRDQLKLVQSREKYFSEQMTFIYSLIEVSNIIRNLNIRKREERDVVLQGFLEFVESRFAGRVCLPILGTSSNGYLKVLKVLYKESVSLSSRDKAPYIVYFEVESACDRSSSYQQCEASDENLKFDHADEGDSVDGDCSFNVIGVQSFLDEIYGESLRERKRRIACDSLFSSLPNWDLVSVIVKNGDDIRQEQLAIQIINIFDRIFQQAKLPIWLNPYEILATSSDGGFIETISDAVSIHSIKVKMQDYCRKLALPMDDSLRQYFQIAYTADDLPEAQTNFAESLAGYSLFCYILQVKDRHNGNILLDREGHVIHIDYGFMISTSPGSLNFESAPFKLTMDFISVLDGKESSIFKHFQNLFCNGFLALRKNYKSIILIVEMMLFGAKISCLSRGPQVIKQLEDRFKLNLTDEEALAFAENLVKVSERNWRTESYDMFQYYSNGIKQ